MVAKLFAKAIIVRMNDEHVIIIFNQFYENALYFM